MITINKIISFIKSCDFELIKDSFFIFDQKAIIQQPSSFENAKNFSMSWLSLKKVAENSNIIYSFKGSLLISHESAKNEIDFARLDKNIIFASNPKLVFTIIFNEFFNTETSLFQPNTGKAVIHPDSKIGQNCTLMEGSIIGPNVTIGNFCKIGPNTVVDNCEISNNVYIGSNSSIGMLGFGFARNNNTWIRFPHLKKVIIHQNVEIGNNTCIDRGSLKDTIICEGVKIDNLIHIAHNVEIGKNSILTAKCIIGGSSIIKENVWIGPNASIMNQIKIGEGALIGLGAVVTKSVPKNVVVVGNPAKILKTKGN